MEELKQHLENIQAMFEANIAVLNNANKENAQKGQKQAEILNDSAKQLNTSIEQLNSKIELIDEVLSDFSPSVEVKHYSIDVKKPLTWILSSIGVIFISLLVCFLFWNNTQEAKRERDYYKSLSTIRESNFYKYRYLKQFSGREMSSFLTRFDDEFEENRIEYIERVIEREKQLDAAVRAKREAELKNQEAIQAQRKLDSINQQIRK